MSEDATLDAFVNAASDEADADPPEGDVDADATSDGVDAAAADSEAAVTSSWSSESEACAACGERAARRWVEGDRLVCGSCKSWSVPGGDACDQ